jgi:hypothetical protein
MTGILNKGLALIFRTLVAQSCTLLYRRFAIGRTSTRSSALELPTSRRMKFFQVAEPLSLALSPSDGAREKSFVVNGSTAIGDSKTVRKRHIPSPHRMGRGPGRGAPSCELLRSSVAARRPIGCDMAEGNSARRASGNVLPENRHETFGLALAAGLCFLAGSVSGGEWQMIEGGRAAALAVPSSGKTGFTQLDSARTGIAFTNLLADARSLANRNLLSGSGVAAGDADGDGWCDLYFCGLDGDNIFYRNLGDWKFADATASAGVAGRNQDSTGAAFADIDGDGDLDLLVNVLGGGTRVFLNDGKAHFAEVTQQAGVASKAGSMSMALADVDGDGDLDLYVTNFRPTTIQDEVATRFRVKMTDGRPVVTMVNNIPVSSPEFTNRFIVSAAGNILELGEADVLYLNNGRGQFSPVSFLDGSFLDDTGKPLVEPPRDWGLAVQFHDMNNDGAPDIYVCNDLYTPDRIWINDGKGKFRALDNFSLRNTSTFSMGVDFADIDRDGDVDFFVVDMLSRDHVNRHVQMPQSRPIRWPIGMIDNRPQVVRNTLQVNRGDNTFAETSYYSGLEASEWSWGPIFLDVDLDGFEDILVATGQLRDFQNADMAQRMEAAKANKQLSQSEVASFMKLFPHLKSPILAFRNRGHLRFEDIGAQWGFGAPGISQGMALADLDNDGDLDLAVNNLHDAAGIYRNDCTSPRVAVRLKGLAANTQGIGAKIKVSGGPPPLDQSGPIENRSVLIQSQEVICGGRYLSGDDPVRVFAGGSLTNELTIEVSWRSGKRSLIKGAKANWIYEISEAGAEAAASDHASRITRRAPTLFQDVSSLINHRHVEEPFEDFDRQPLLPNRLSQLGPGVCWHDLDSDGWDDLIIGSGRSGQLAVYRNNQHGGFEALKDSPLNRPVTRDQTGVLGFRGNVIIGSSNYEDGLTNGGCIRIYDLNNKAVSDSILGQSSSAGPLAMGDIDGDGDLDLFVGGRAVPGRYPEPAASMMVMSEGGKFVPGQRWEKLGLVSGAVLSDLNGDGFPELILACEWGPVRLFSNEKGTFKEITQESGFAEHKGLWAGITTGDLDGDGKLEIIATNWGLNSRLRASRNHPRKIYFGDLDGNGTLDIVESRYEEAMGKQVPERGFRAVRAALPFLAEKVETFEAYGKAGINELYGEKLDGAEKMVEINSLASMVFFNRGGRFEGVELPKEAQLSPAFGVSVGDVNGDGDDDIFLSQNFFAVNSENTRSDAGRGLWLMGNGKGGLEAAEGHESGVKVYGEQRGSALSDFDGDGRLDLVVSQNGAETKLYRNVGATPGLRVRLKGPIGNPTGVGAAIQLVGEKSLGALREIKAGSGYWSQDSAVQLMSLKERPNQARVRWPGGKITTSQIPKQAKEVVISADGKLEVLR